MFSGIVDHTGTLEKIIQKPKGLLFCIRSQFTDFSLGESIAIDGMCLTVTNHDTHTFECELSPETLNVTIAGHYSVGQSLNLERAMRMNDRIGGHLVTGHIDETLIVNKKIQHNDFVELHFSVPSKKSQAYLISKGSVTVNGVSLTVNAIDQNGFSVMLIPHTLERTNLSNLDAGMHVNVEWDYVAKIIQRQSELVLESYFQNKFLGETL